MSLRLIANAYRCEGPRPLAARHCSDTIDALGNSMEYESIHVRVAYITLLYNACVHLRFQVHIETEAETGRDRDEEKRERE
mmetsp:Transcript_61470/g.145376  ORF Transcript_61470/g.145376 Transcript_61470/m.145376 type:complete len:81 (-) Transcript_61470:23-265(-)